MSACSVSWLRIATLMMGMVVLLSPLPAAPADAAKGLAGWQLAKIEGRDHVSVDSVRQFYRFAEIERSGKSLSMRNAKVVMKLAIDSPDCFMNGMKFVLCHAVREQDGKAWISRTDLSKLIDPVLRPNFIRNAGNFQTVILDPGHGGKDLGATNPLGTEAHYNLKLAEKTRDLLAKRGFKVVMTRQSDEFLSLQQRVDLANSVRDNAVFVSIHFNSGGKQARGIETFTLSPPGVSHYGRDMIASDFLKRAGNEHDSANIALATAVHGQLLTRLKAYTFDRGVKRARFNVLSGVRHPAILLEGGFMSHPYEARLIHDEKYQNALANGVVEAIVRYRHAVGVQANPLR